MKKKKLLLLGVGAFLTTLPSCSDNDDSFDKNRPTAIVTVCPNADGSFIMQLDNTTQLIPTNLKASPFGSKEVRALVNYTETGTNTIKDNIRNVQVNWIDSIRTKMPVESTGELNDIKFGKDPLEIIADWVTVAEDGYLTLRIRTVWGTSNAKHFVNLLYGTNPTDPYEFELRHNANGDTYGQWGDALIAFNLNNLSQGNDDTKKIKLKWKSFTGDKSIEFEIKMRSGKQEIDASSIRYSKDIK